MRKLKTCIHALTVGGEVFKSGTVLTEKEAHPSLVDAANTGRKINGFLLAEWVEEPVLETGMTAKDEPEAPVTPEAPAEATLADLIKTLVREGESKTAITEALGASDQYSQRGVRAEFDRLLEAGEIVAGDKSGEYSVA